MTTTNSVYEAAASGNLEYFKKNIAHVNEKNDRGWTQLHYAARFGQVEIAKYLKENNADLTSLTKEGKTPSQLATLWGNEDLGELLADEKKKESPFPDNYIAVFAGNPLNRYGWNRNKPEFLAKLARASTSKYMVLNNMQALYTKEGELQFLGYNDVSAAVDRVYNETGAHDNLTDDILVFMGIDETRGLGEEGEAYWALDVTATGKNEEANKQLIKDLESKGYEFASTLPRAFSLSKPISAMIAQAAAIVDWNKRTKFCSACGRRTILLEAGYKRTCPDDENNEAKCISHTRVQNFTYPRTDPVVIVCIVHPTEDKILLGRNKRWPAKMFSCVSGFVEGGETLEEAVRREALEETGVMVNRVAYHSSQPWPFPNSLMLGFIAEAVSEDISFSDDELEAAAWFTRNQVISAIKGEDDAVFSMAPKGSLASTLVHSWVYDEKWQFRNEN